MAVDTGTVQVTMPAMGDSVAEGTVLEWHKAEGEAVSLDETIVEISTDKVDAEVPAPVAGTAPSSSGLGRSPLKAEIAGSNPAGATSTPWFSHGVVEYRREAIFR